MQMHVIGEGEVHAEWWILGLTRDFRKLNTLRNPILATRPIIPIESLPFRFAKVFH